MNNSLEYLENLLKSKAKEFYSLRDKVERVRTKEVLPSLKKKYEGRYFKYRNSSGGDNQWWLYSKCIKVISEREGIFNCFETSPYKNEFKVGSKEFFHLCGHPITKQQYHRALKSFLAKCKSL